MSSTVSDNPYGEFNLSRAGFESFLNGEIETILDDKTNEGLEDVLLRHGCLVMARKLASCKPSPAIDHHKDYRLECSLLEQIQLPCSQPLVDVVDKFGPFDVYGMQLYPRSIGAIMNHYLLMAISLGQIDRDLLRTTVINWSNKASRRFLKERVHQLVTRLADDITLKAPVADGWEGLSVRAPILLVGSVAAQRIANLQEYGCTVSAHLELVIEAMKTLDDLSQYDELSFEQLQLLNEYVGDEFTVVLVNPKLMEEAFHATHDRVYKYYSAVARQFQSYLSLPRFDTQGDPWQLYLLRDGNLVGPFKTGKHLERLAWMLGCEDADVKFPLNAYVKLSQGKSREDCILDFYASYLEGQ